MKISEIAPPGREKQVKKLKKKFDDPGAPYAIAWAQHNKHGKPKKNEGKMSDIDIDIKTLSDADFEKKYGKSKAQMQKDLAEQDVPTQKGRDAKPDVLTPRAMNVVKKQIKKDANKQRRADSKKAVDVEEAPFGQAVKGALGRAANKVGTSVKKAVGNVPGLGDLKTAAQGEQNIMKVADETWKSFIQYKQSNPTDDQIQGWFKQRGMEVKDGNVDKNTVIQGVKQAIARDQGGPAKPNDPNASQAPNQDSEIEKVKTANLQKLAPEIKAQDIPKAKSGIEKLAGGQMASKKEIEAMLPLIKGIANTLSNTGKSSIVGKQMQKESLSQTDLSKLDMLARQGMVPKNKVARFKTAMRTLSKGKDLPISYKDDVIDVVLKLSKIITKPSVMGMIRKGLRENQDPKNTFDKWVKKAKKEYDI